MDVYSLFNSAFGRARSLGFGPRASSALAGMVVAARVAAQPDQPQEKSTAA